METWRFADYFVSQFHNNEQTVSHDIRHFLLLALRRLLLNSSEVLGTSSATSSKNVVRKYMYVCEWVYVSALW